jgi:hypothetical protein
LRLDALAYGYRNRLMEERSVKIKAISGRDQFVSSL